MTRHAKFISVEQTLDSQLKGLWGKVSINCKNDVDDVDDVNDVDVTHQQHAVDDVRRRRVAALQELRLDASTDRVESSGKEKLES